MTDDDTAKPSLKKRIHAAAWVIAVTVAAWTTVMVATQTGENRHHIQALQGEVKALKATTRPADPLFTPTAP